MNVLATIADLCISLLTQDTVTMGFPEEKTLKWRCVQEVYKQIPTEERGKAGLGQLY